MRGFIFFFTCILLFVSCIKDAPQNPEADIESFDVDPKLLTGQTFIDQTNSKIMLYLTAEAYENGIIPAIKVSSNAIVSPESGKAVSFKNNAKISYTVTAQNKTNKKTYTLEIVNVGDWNFEFENWQQNNDDKYEYPVEDNKSEIWTSGNPGVALSGVPQERLAYPTRSTTDGYSGTLGAEMVTIKGTTLSAFVGIYLYAGSLFIGNFNPENVLTEPLSATEFGQPYIGLPGRFTGVYKYSPGANYQDENQNIIPDKVDECSIYAVLFEGPQRLNGTNINTSDRVVATAKLSDGSAKATFTKFDIPFIYKAGWTPSANQNLLLTIVASSSKDGDHYKGAIGSRLVVDNLAIVPK